MKSVLAKQPDGTIQLTITIPAELVKKTWDETLEELAKQIEIPGFRKGKAPIKLVEEKLDKEKVREEVLKKLLPKTYVEAVEEHKLKPFVTPKIHVQKLEDPTTSSGHGWEFQATTAEMPEIDLNGYKDNIKKLTAKSKIILPGKPFGDAQDKQEVKFDEIVKALLESVKVTIPRLLIDQETDRLLSQTLDEIKKLGLTLDQYLQSTRRKAEDLRNEYQKKAETDLKLELTLQKIAQTEKITVEEKEIEEAITKAKDENERKNLQSNRYLLASILRQQKTLDFLKSL